MCVILHCTTVRPSKELLERCNKKNPDGIGIANFVKVKGKPKIRVRKGITIEQLFELTEKLPLPYVIHFRFKTIGDATPEMCHPFPVTGQAELMTDYVADKVLFHNGTFDDWEHYIMHLSASNPEKYPMPKAPWSDSRALAWLTYHMGPNYLSLINNRFLVMDATAEEGQKVKRYSQWWNYEKRVVTGEDSDEMEEGVEFSNNYWTKSGK